MECFRHPGAGAAGVCVACGKGLCRECAGDAGGRLHCEGECAQDAELQRRTLLGTSRARAMALRLMGPIALLLFLAGASLLVLGFVWGDVWAKVVGIVVGGGTILFVAVLAIALRNLAKAEASGIEGVPK